MLHFSIKIYSSSYDWPDMCQCDFNSSPALNLYLLYYIEDEETVVAYLNSLGSWVKLSEYYYFTAITT